MAETTAAQTFFATQLPNERYLWTFKNVAGMPMYWNHDERKWTPHRAKATRIHREDMQRIGTIARLETMAPEIYMEPAMDEQEKARLG